MMRVLAILFLALASRAANAELPQPLAAALAASGIPESAVGILVQRLPDGATVLAHGADRSLAPGSSMKILTTAVAIDRLGPEYRGRTELRSVAPIVDGVLRGDLVLRGLGDPNLDWRAFERMLERLRHQGLREIRGNLVLDRSFFDPARADMGKPPFDEAPEFRYNVIPDALMLNTNLVGIDLASNGRALSAHLATPLDRVKVVSEMTLVERDCTDWEDGWKIPEIRASGGDVAIVLRGEYPRDCNASTQVEVLDRVQLADRMFRALWRRLGGRFHGRTYEDRPRDPGKLLVEHRSRALSDVLREVNKDSDNPTARVLYLTLGALAQDGTAAEATARRSERVVRQWLDSHAIGHTSLVMENGSGLSRQERVTPELLAAVLRSAIRGPWAPEFVSSLPIVGIDGTMRSRLRESPAAGRARMKTGTLNQTSALAGYVDRAGTTYVVVAIINHPLAHHRVARPLLDLFVDWFVRQPARAAGG